MRRLNVKTSVQAIVVTAIICVAAPQSAAETGSGQELLQDCEIAMQFITQEEAYLKGKPFSAAEAVATHRCLAFLDGVFRTTMVHKIMGSQPIFCTPVEGLPRGDAAKIYVKWATANSDKLVRLRIVNVVQAFQDAFPCK